MREPNLCFPSHNKAAVCITSALYDRRALDCTASLPLVNSLTHLAYLTSTSPRVREILVKDGGLERLIRILSPQHLEPERRNLWKWSLAFQCVVNVGVRGTEQIRTKVVDAGMIPIVLHVLENFLRALELVRQESDRQDNKATNNNLLPSSATSSSTQHTDYTGHQELLEGLLSRSRTAEQNVLDSHQLGLYSAYIIYLESLFTVKGCMITHLSFMIQVDTTTATMPLPIVNTANLPSFTFSSSSSNNNNNNIDTMIPTTDDDNNNSSHGKPISPRQEHRVLRKSTFPYIKITAAQRRKNRLNRTARKTVPTWQDPREPNVDNVFYREEDILLSLQLLAYLSKYPHIRNQFHTNYDRNVFSVVERFCHRLHPNPIQYWAGVIMRNACRKDETKGGTRRCANMHCGKWESQPREFAKCRRCRKAKYCCKACQSKAWSDGHRWWCVERHGTVPPPSSTLQSSATTTTTTTTTAIVAPAPAVTQQQQQQQQQQQPAQQPQQPQQPQPQTDTQFLEQVQRYQMLQQQLLSEPDGTVGANASTTNTPWARSATPTPSATAFSNSTEGRLVSDIQSQQSLGEATFAGTEGTSRHLDSTQRDEQANDLNRAVSTTAQVYQSRADQFRRQHHHQAFQHLLSTPATTVPTMNPIGHRLSSPGQQHTTQQEDQHSSPQQQQQQSPQPSAILVNDLPLGNTHNNLSVIDQDLDESTQNGSTESSGNHASLLMDVGMQMEI